MSVYPVYSNLLGSILDKQKKKKIIRDLVPTSRNLQHYIFNLEITHIVSFLFYTYNYMASYINVILLSPELN